MNTILLILSKWPPACLPWLTICQFLQYLGRLKSNFGGVKSKVSLLKLATRPKNLWLALGLFQPYQSGPKNTSQQTGYYEIAHLVCEVLAKRQASSSQMGYFKNLQKL